MGHSQAEKNATHERIIGTAARRFRETGVDGVGVADLMKDAGFTHGGFYRHFASREDLVAEALERALSDGARAVAKVASSPLAPWSKVVDLYLSKAHRDDWATSCAVATLAADVARSSPRARTAYTRQVERYLELLGKLIAGKADRSTRNKAIAALSTLVGAISIARAVNDEKLSREILRTVADELKAQAQSG